MESISNLKESGHLKLSVIALAIQPSIQLPKEDIQNVLTSLKKDIPELSKRAKYDNEDNYYLIGNAEKDTDKEIILRIWEKSGVMELALGPFISSDTVSQLINNIFGSLKDLTPLYIGSIMVLDNRFTFEAHIKANHYNIINRIFFLGSPIENIFTDKERYENDFTIRGLLDEDKQVYIQVVGRTSQNEILNQEFQEKRLTLTVGLGQTSNISQEDICKSIFNHYQIGSNFIKDRIMPKMIEKFNKLIDTITKEED